MKMSRRVKLELRTCVSLICGPHALFVDDLLEPKYSSRYCNQVGLGARAKKITTGVALVVAGMTYGPFRCFVALSLA